MSEYAAFVGWDWADKEHEIVLSVAESDTVSERRQIRGTPESLHEWAAEMRARFVGEKIALCIESSRGAVIWALMCYEHIVLYPVNPKSAASFRESFYPSGKKDDPVDADVLWEMVAKHHHKLRPLVPADPATRSLGMLSEFRRKLVQQLLRLVAQLRSNLKSYFPQALELAGDLDTKMGCDFLEKWPTLRAVQCSQAKTLASFYRAHSSRSNELIDRRIALVRAAVPLTNDEAIVRCGQIKTRTLVPLIRQLLNAITEVEREIEPIYRDHPLHTLLESFSGLGSALGPRVAAILGTDRNRFASADELQRLTGVAPITKKSGGHDGTKSVHRRLKRSKFMHQTMVEWAGCAALRSEWARAFYEQQQKLGKSHYAILRALAYKLIKVLFRCWATETEYDERRYQESLIRRGSPIAARLAA